MTEATRPICGLLNLHKPIGWTSRDAVDRVARPLRRIKVGHAGTLDPLASGVLVVCIGAATRLIEYVQAMPKSYRTVVRLGATSDTLDADGAVTETPDPRIPDEADIRAALAVQVGTIQQVPPQYSALKVEGRRAYDIARAGETVELAARPVRVDRIDLLAYAWPRAEFAVDCGSGTYIRAIARDVGEALGCGALVEVLARTRIGPFALEDAVDPARLDRAAIVAALRPAREAVSGLPALAITPDQLSEILRGLPVDLGPVAAGEVALIGPGGELAAVAESRPATGRVWPRRVLATTG